MPIEVRELVIRATIIPEGESPTGAPSSGSPATLPTEETIKFCVDKVLDILKERNGR